MAVYDFNRINIYLVEDNSFVRGVLEDVLRHLKFANVYSARNGAEAIEYFRTLNKSQGLGEIDIILSDLIMSPMNGLLMLRWIRTAKESIRVRPDYGMAHRHLSSMLNYSEKNNSHILEMESAYKEESTNQEDRMHIAFGLGKAYEDLRDYEKAFSFLQEGNRIHRGSIDYSTESRLKSFTLLKENFSKDFFDNYNSLSTQGEKMIFIIGMPRSGTSLVEQIISSHSRVYGAGERRFLKEAVDFGIPAIMPNCW